MKKIMCFITVMVLFIASDFMSNSVSAYDVPVLNGSITVNGESIQAPASYISQDGITVMVPLRPIVDVLGISVAWQEENRGVILGGSYKLGIDDMMLYMGENYMGSHSPAPEITEDRIFVPLFYFSHILNGFSADVVEGTVIIETLPYFVYREMDNVTHTTFNVGAPSYLATNIEVGHNETGELFSLLHLPVGADFAADEVTSARLYMKIADGEAPPFINL